MVRDSCCSRDPGQKQALVILAQGDDSARWAAEQQAGAVRLDAGRSALDVRRTREMMATFVLLVASLLITAGCDPGWRYHVLGAQIVDRSGYRLESHGIGVTIHGSLLSADISIDLELTNLDAGPLSIDTNLVRAVDARGSSLRMIEWYRVPESISTMPVVLGFGETSRVQRTFAANAFAGLRRNPNLRVITLFIDGITRGGQPIPFQATLEWE